MAPSPAPAWGPNTVPKTASTPSTPVTPSCDGRAQSASTSTAGTPQANMNAAVTNLSLAPTKSKFATRPGSGSLGVKIQASVNFFRVDISQVPDILEYTVQLRCEAKNLKDADIRGRIRMQIITILLDENHIFKYAASDYVNRIVSTHALSPADSTETYPVKYYEPEDPPEVRAAGRGIFTVIVRYTRTFSSQYHRSVREQAQDFPEDHLAAFNILLARGPSQDPNMVTTARRQKFFNVSANNGRQDLTGGIEMYRGYYRSAKLTCDGMMVNLHVAAAAMIRPGRLDEVTNEIVKVQNITSTEHQVRIINRVIRACKVEHNYTGNAVRKSVTGIARVASGVRPGASNVRFVKEGVTTSVETHFRSTYPNVQRPNPNALVVQLRAAARQIFIPSDLCRIIPGQPYRRPLDPAQTANMIRFACRKPAENKRLIISEGLAQMGVNIAGGPRDRFAISIDQRMIEVPARILPKPTLSYASGSFTDLSTGSWYMTDKKFRQPAPKPKLIISWLEFLLPRVSPLPARDKFFRVLREVLQKYTGFSKVEILTFENFRHHLNIIKDVNQDILKDPLRFLKNKGVQLILMILPSTSSDNYRVIKQFADTEGPGIHTVCFVRTKKGIVESSIETAANLTLKVNPKLGGINVTLQTPPQLKTLFSHRIMFIGADVVS